jgi:hypothetical protein
MINKMDTCSSSCGCEEYNSDKVMECAIFEAGSITKTITRRGKPTT